MKYRAAVIISAAMILLSTAGGFASDWVQIYSDEDYTIYADRASVVPMGDFFEIAERWEYKTAAVKEPLAKESGQLPKYDITVKKYQKKQPVYQIISITYYNEKEEPYYSPARDDAWRILSPGMLGALLWRKIIQLMQPHYQKTGSSRFGVEYFASLRGILKHTLQKCAPPFVPHCTSEAKRFCTSANAALSLKP